MEQPKVRFSQVHTGEEEMIINKSKGKVKIKSIVPTSYPVKVLKNGQHVLLKEQKSSAEINKGQSNSSNVNGCSKIYSSTSSIPSLYISEMNNSSSENEYENVNNPYVPSDNQNVKNKDVNLEECIDKLQCLSFEHSSNSMNCLQQNSKIRENANERESLQSSKNESFKTCLELTLDEDSDVEVIKVIKHPADLKSIKTCKDNKKKNFRKENKENKSIKGILTNKQQSSNKNKILKDTTNPSSNKSKNVASKKFTKSQNKMQLMPCAKFRETCKNKCTGKTKKEEIRKSVVYNTVNSHNNISVEPGTFHKKCNHPVNNDVEKLDEKKNIVSEDLLSRPEYNSTICIMKQLKKLENEKPITDFKHVPQEYRNFIYGKVSAALDVGLYECVYKDLINISVDDKKLPARLMRSKDPEPRDKDIVPKLSDFYQPKYAEQYFIVANPVVPRPVNLNTLSAFTISNKICTWKNSRDNL